MNNTLKHIQIHTYIMTDRRTGSLKQKTAISLLVIGQEDERAPSSSYQDLHRWDALGQQMEHQHLLKHDSTPCVSASQYLFYIALTLHLSVFSCYQLVHRCIWREQPGI